MSPQELGLYSIGIGDRFGQQGAAQLRACRMALEQGVEITPVWNKSHREHTIVGSDPSTQRNAADRAVAELSWNRPYFVDADHITLATVEPFLPYCDFFTLDVAEDIGRAVERAEAETFISRHPELCGRLAVEGLDEPLEITREQALAAAQKYLAAVRQAGKIYRFIRERKGQDSFVTEISMDETDSPQTPAELLVILAAIADEGIPAQTIAPKFSGRFNKGVDYVGDPEQFQKEFSADIAVIRHATRTYPLPSALKLSVHSGSDKFSLYPLMRAAMVRSGAGVHLKTAGTTWLEELAGLAEAGGEGLEIVREVYRAAYSRQQELTAPYAAVIDIRHENLPHPDATTQWTSEQWLRALVHNPRDPLFNPDLRQLLHVAYKIAAELGQRYLDALAACRDQVARRVTTNLFERHIRPLFLST